MAPKDLATVCQPLLYSKDKVATKTQKELRKRSACFSKEKAVGDGKKERTESELKEEGMPMRN